MECKKHFPGVLDLMMKRSRVILIIENMSFPQDRRVRQEAAALVSAGFGVTVICPRGSTHDTSRFEVVDGVATYRYHQPWQGNGFLSYLLEYSYAILCTLGVLLYISMTDGFDVLHTATPPDLFFVLAAPFKLFGKKFVYDQHDLSPEIFASKFRKDGFIRKILVLLERWSYRVADLVIVTNQSFYQIAIERGRVDPTKLCVVRNGPDLDKFRPVAARTELKHDAHFLAVYVGVMNEQDGVDIIIRAAHHIVFERDRKDIRFALLGTGSYYEELQRLAHSLGVQSCIDFPGWLEDKELLEYLSTADVCLAPDPPIQLNQLCTTIKVMEYMACGKPIISFDLLETRRSADGAAIYVNGSDPSSFGDAVIELVDNKELRNRLGNKGLERVRNELNWGRSKEVLLNGYKRLLGRS